MTFTKQQPSEAKPSQNSLIPDASIQTPVFNKHATYNPITVGRRGGGGGRLKNVIKRRITSEM